MNVSKYRQAWKGRSMLWSQKCQARAKAQMRRSDEARGLLLHVVLLVLLHPPADEEEQQRAQHLVAHLQAQVPVGRTTQDG